MGVGQSTALTCYGRDMFVHENADALRSYMIRLNDTAEFVDRRRWLEAKRMKETVLASADHDDGIGTAKEADEERAMWLPFAHLLLANHYMSDLSLLEPLTTSYFYRPPRPHRSHDNTDVDETNESDEERDDIDGTVAVPMNALDILCRNGNLQTLDLGFNNLTALIMNPLVTALEPLHQLRSLSLSGNAIGLSGCVCLGRYLAANPVLERLSLFQCELVDEDLVPLIQGLANPHAANVVTSGSVGGGSGDRQSVSMHTGSANSSRRSVTAMVSAGNTHLRYLNLDFNHLTDLSVRRFVHLTYCDNSRRSSGHSSSTTTTTNTTDTLRDAVAAAQTESDASVTCVGTGNNTLAVILYESCPHDPATLRVLDPFIYMSGRRLEYACTASGYFRSGGDYRPEDVAESSPASRDAMRENVTVNTITSGLAGGGGGKHGSSSVPTTVASTSTLPPPPPGLVTSPSLSHTMPRGGSSSSTTGGGGMAGEVVDPLPAGPLDISENVYYDGTFVEEELAVVSDQHRKVAARERYRLRRLMLTRDFAGLTPFDPFLRRHLSALLVKRRLAYEQELRQQRRLLMETTVEAAAAMRSRSALWDREVGPEENTGDEAVAAPAPSPSRAAQWPVRSNDMDDMDDTDVLSEAEERVEAGGVGEHAAAAAAQARELRGAPGGGNAGKRRTGGPSGRALLSPLDSEERLEMVRREAELFRQTHTKLGTVTKSGLDHRIVPNGFDKVLLAASAHGLGDGGESAVPRDRRHNRLVNESMANHLEACWCEPQDASLLYGGSLHYHCIREHAVLYGNQTNSDDDNNNKDGEAMAGARRRTQTASHSVKTTKSTTVPARDADLGADTAESQRAHRMVRQRKMAYRGCQGTGHRCISQHEAGPSAQPTSLLPPLTLSANGSAAPTRPRGEASSRAASRRTSTGLPRVGTADRREETTVVHTSQCGMRVALNYNPVVYFSSAYVPSAPIQDECTL